MTGLPLDHVAMATPDLDATVALYERLTGSSGSVPERIPAQGVRVSFVGQVEILEPLGPDSTVARFLERNGPGLHHVAYRSEDIASDLARLREEGFELVDEAPRPGAGGHLVAFLHPRSTGRVLVELVQHP